MSSFPGPRAATGVPVGASFRSGPRYAAAGEIRWRSTRQVGGRGTNSHPVPTRRRWCSVRSPGCEEPARAIEGPPGPAAGAPRLRHEGRPPRSSTACSRRPNGDFADVGFEGPAADLDRRDSVVRARAGRKGGRGTGFPSACHRRRECYPGARRSSATEFRLPLVWREIRPASDSRRRSSACT